MVGLRIRIQVYVGCRALGGRSGILSSGWSTCSAGCGMLVKGGEYGVKGSRWRAHGVEFEI